MKNNQSESTNTHSQQKSQRVDKLQTEAARNLTVHSIIRELENQNAKLHQQLRISTATLFDLQAKYNNILGQNIPHNNTSNHWELQQNNQRLVQELNDANKEIFALKSSLLKMELCLRNIESGNLITTIDNEVKEDMLSPVPPKSQRQYSPNASRRMTIPKLSHPATQTPLKSHDVVISPSRSTSPKLKRQTAGNWTEQSKSESSNHSDPRTVYRMKPNPYATVPPPKQHTQNHIQEKHVSNGLGITDDTQTSSNTPYYGIGNNGREKPLITPRKVHQNRAAVLRENKGRETAFAAQVKSELLISTNHGTSALRSIEAPTYSPTRSQSPARSPTLLSSRYNPYTTSYQHKHPKSPALVSTTGSQTEVSKVPFQKAIILSRDRLQEILSESSRPSLQDTEIDGNPPFLLATPPAMLLDIDHSNVSLISMDDFEAKPVITKPIHQTPILDSLANRVENVQKSGPSPVDILEMMVKRRSGMTMLPISNWSCKPALSKANETLRKAWEFIERLEKIDDEREIAEQERRSIDEFPVHTVSPTTKHITNLHIHNSTSPINIIPKRPSSAASVQHPRATSVIHKFHVRAASTRSDTARDPVRALSLSPTRPTIFDEKAQIQASLRGILGEPMLTRTDGLNPVSWEPTISARPKSYVTSRSSKGGAFNPINWAANVPRSVVGTNINSKEAVDPISWQPRSISKAIES